MQGHNTTGDCQATSNLLKIAGVPPKGRARVSVLKLDGTTKTNSEVGTNTKGIPGVDPEKDSPCDRTAARHGNSCQPATRHGNSCQPAKQMIDRSIGITDFRKPSSHRNKPLPSDSKGHPFCKMNPQQDHNAMIISHNQPTCWANQCKDD